MQGAEGRGQRAESKGQRTEDRGQRTEDRGQRLEDRAPLVGQLVLLPMAAEQQKRQAEALERILIQPVLNAIDGIQGAFSDAFKDILDGGVTSFEDFGDTVAEIMKVTASEIAAALVFEATFENLDPETILNGLGIPKDGSVFGADTEVTEQEDFTKEVVRGGRRFRVIEGGRGGRELTAGLARRSGLALAA